MNLRNGHYTKDLIKKLLMSFSILKLNESKVRKCHEIFKNSQRNWRGFCEWSINEFELECVCITKGPDGSAVYFNDEYTESPGYKLKVVDPFGADDSFAVVFLYCLSKNLKLNKPCDFANRLGAITVKSNSAISDWKIEEVLYN